MKLTPICLWITALALVACSGGPPAATPADSPGLEDEEETQPPVRRRVGSNYSSGMRPMTESSADAGMTPEQAEQIMAQIADGGIAAKMEAMFGDCGNPDGGCDTSAAFSGIDGIGNPPEEQTDD
jgi:hypothetical protein